MSGPWLNRLNAINVPEYLVILMSYNKNQKNLPPLAPMIKIKTSQSFQEKANDLPTDNNQDYFMTEADQEFAGKHYIVDFWGTQFLQDIELMEKALKDAAHIADATLLHIHLHQFSNHGGITGVALLAESHISVHTWPERGYAAFDVFMCGNAKPELAVDLLKQVFKPEKVDVNEILRGKRL